jgi:hypothetical protein
VPSYVYRSLSCSEDDDSFRLSESDASESMNILVKIVLYLVLSSFTTARTSNTILSGQAQAPARVDALDSSETTVMSCHVELPERLLIGYANWNQCDETILRAVQQGVNVVIWFSINLAVDDNGLPTITNGPDWSCVANRIKDIRDFGFTDVVHLISIGGWNSPHPDTSHSAEVMFEHWDHWNRHTIARPELGFAGFAGFDWDVEGNDQTLSRFNHFTVSCLDLMGRMSQLARNKGYVVAMAPAGIYLFAYFCNRRCNTKT